MINAKQKLYLIGFIILAIGIILFGANQIYNQIYQPFAKPIDSQLTADLSQIDLAELQNKLNASQMKDTDDDGITDLIENANYQTSPYLADSDSDSYNDKEEIDAGSNPLDPQSTPANINIEPVEQQIEVKEQEETEISAERIRQALQLAGMDQDILQQVNDQTLLELYQQTVQQTGTDLIKLQETQPIETDNDQLTNLDLSNLSDVEENQIIKQYLETLTSDQLRQLLIEQGIDLQTLNQLSDQDLKNIFEQVINE
ncbi:MAG: hypothetical protein KAS12_00500 [Candidatus Aenigmarchaeota archaeon]|nr:hypothetical protein [Candidatus Aenigmarchaeota archaeon]